MRGTPGSWRDRWEQDDETERAAEQARAQVAQFDAVVQRVGAAWRGEINAEGRRPGGGRARVLGLEIAAGGCRSRGVDSGIARPSKARKHFVG